MKEKRNGSFDHTSYKNGNPVENEWAEYFTGNDWPSESGAGSKKRQQYMEDSFEDAETKFLSARLIAWQSLLQSSLSLLVSSVEEELEAKKAAQSSQKDNEAVDLGMQYNDARLNTTWLNPDTGEETNLYRSWEDCGFLKFECTVCHVTVAGKRSMESHMEGRKHKLKLEGFEVTEGVISVGGDELIPDKSLLIKLLERLSDPVTVVGLQFIVEVLIGRGEPEFHCLLCNCSGMSIQAVFSHILSVGHRLAVLRKLDPKASENFNSEPPPGQWSHKSLNQLEEAVTEMARLRGNEDKPTLLSNPIVFEAQRSNLMAGI